MGELSAYLAAVIRQREMLERASGLDSMSQTPHLSRRRTSTDRPRPWLKQDRNRAAFETACLITDEEAEAQGKSPGEYVYPEPAGRIETRVSRILRRWPGPSHHAALAEVAANGTHDVLAPVIVKLQQAHERLRRHISGRDFESTWDGYSRQMPSREAVEQQHDEAIEALRPYAPPAHNEDGPAPRLAPPPRHGTQAACLVELLRKGLDNDAAAERARAKGFDTVDVAQVRAIRSKYKHLLNAT